MICIKTQHFNINRILLLAIGLWPYQQSKLVRLQVILLFVILVSSVTFQFTAFLTAECTPGFVVKVLSYAISFMTFIIKYNSFWINSKTLKYLLDQLENICNQLKDENEISIIKKYGWKAKNYTIKLTFLLFTVQTLTILSTWQSIFCTLLHVKETQFLRPMQMKTEYFIDEKKFSNIILTHMTAAFCIGLTVLVGTGSMLIAYLKHACGMFTIASYRIEQAMMNKSQNNNSLENSIMVYQKMIRAIYIHRKAMEFSEYLISNFEGSFFFLIIFGVASLSFNLVRISQEVQGHTEELIMHLLIVVLTLLYMFLANDIGEEIMDHNNKVFSTAYNIRWYMTSLRVQKLILFLLQRSSKTFGLNIGGLFVSSLECFAKLASASISYFTVIYSMQK